ncbi:MAG: DnaJ domain-containing protein [Bacteroidota bacterium]
MADYYSILGVSRTANDLEIKAAFRRLAKIYHPDKNPNNPDARHVFENVLKAYNTLIHPSSRRRYDQRGGESHTPQTSKTQHTKRKNQKEWTFTEEELQRRQYYEKYYKAKQQERARHQTPPPKAHSDYKYILFATPIAVALFMLIVSMFTENPKTVPLAPKKAVTEPIQTVSKQTGTATQLPNGEKPYTGYFGGVKTYNTPNTLGLNNQSGYDAVIVLFDKKTNAYLQNVYVQDSYSIEFHKLPNTGVYWKVMLGKGWNENKLMAEKEAIGAFDSIVQFQNWKNEAFIPKSNVATLYTELRVAAAHAHKKTISTEADFFAK